MGTKKYCSIILDSAFRIVQFVPISRDVFDDVGYLYRSTHTQSLYGYMGLSLFFFFDQSIASANPLKPNTPSKLLGEKRMRSALPVKIAVEGVETAVEDVVELPLEVDVEFPLAGMNTPPLMAGGEILLAFTAAAL